MMTAQHTAMNATATARIKNEFSRRESRILFEFIQH